MTELEQCLYDWLLKDTGIKNKICAKARAAKLLRLACKQIASEIDVSRMVKKYEKENPMGIRSCYRDGIEDVLKLVKEGGK